ncbi:SDR family oxidoreductase [Sporosarcina siberiensis]|uniref:SDR family oxidoreductase n=1 Tax=Sporosarcina siberiensis TaxID=1365606 RepID=A0ABW4SG59_9BACL
MVPQKRQLSVQEIAEIALFIASDKGKGMTGQSIIIDGGNAAQ